MLKSRCQAHCCSHGAASPCPGSHARGTASIQRGGFRVGLDSAPLFVEIPSSDRDAKKEKGRCRCQRDRIKGWPAEDRQFRFRQFALAVARNGLGAAP